MADSLPNIPLPSNTWVDLYAESNPPIVVGTQLIVQNVGASQVKLVTKAIAPTEADGFTLLNPIGEKVNQAGASGAWAYSEGVLGKVNVGAA